MRQNGSFWIPRAEIGSTFSAASRLPTRRNHPRNSSLGHELSCLTEIPNPSARFPRYANGTLRLKSCHRRRCESDRGAPTLNGSSCHNVPGSLHSPSDRFAQSSTELIDSSLNGLTRWACGLEHNRMKK